MSKSIKRLGAALLTGTMMVGMAAGASAVTYVAKIGSTGYKTLTEALEKVRNGQTIVLQSNITNECSVYDDDTALYGVGLYYEASASKSFTIDFNGHTVTERHSGAEFDGSMDAIYLGAGEDAGNLSITMKNGSIVSTADGTDGILITDENPSTPMTLTLNNMTIKASGEAAVNCFDAKLVVQSANLTGRDDAIYAENSTVNLIAGQFVGTGEDSDDGAVAVYDDDMKLNMDAVTTPGAPAIVRPSDWKTNPSTDISVLNFNDVKSGDWYYNYVYEMAGKGVVSGVKCWQFKPNDNVTREQFASILANAAGADLSQYKNKSEYSDVSSTKWSAPAIEWARVNDIASGSGKGKFSPTASITREQACVMLFKYQANIMKLEPQELVDMADYPDLDTVSTWAEDAVHVMLREGVMSGTAGKNGVAHVSPKGKTTRAQACTLISKLLALAETAQ